MPASWASSSTAWALVGVSLLTRPMDDALLQQFKADEETEPGPRHPGVQTRLKPGHPRQALASSAPACWSSRCFFNQTSSTDTAAGVTPLMRLA